MAAKKRVRWRRGCATIAGLHVVVSKCGPWEASVWSSGDDGSDVLANADGLTSQREARRVAEFLAVVVSERKVKRGK